MKTYASAILCVLASMSVCAARAGEINVQVEGIAGRVGTVYAAACEKKHFLSRDFLNECVAVANTRAAGPEASLVLHDVPMGRFAVMVFLDLNGNGQLDFNKVGIPTEPGGFSGGFQVFPNFEQAALNVGAKPLETKVRIRCLFC